MSHTPGPWKIVHYSTCEDLKEIGNVQIENHLEESIIDGCGCCDSPRMSSIEDLHLIAAAPELLDALHDLGSYAQLCESFLRETHPGKADFLGKKLAKARAAIDKARGQE